MFHTQLASHPTLRPELVWGNYATHDDMKLPFFQFLRGVLVPLVGLAEIPAPPTRGAAPAVGSSGHKKSGSPFSSLGVQDRYRLTAGPCCRCSGAFWMVRKNDQGPSGARRPVARPGIEPGGADTRSLASTKKAPWREGASNSPSGRP